MFVLEPLSIAGEGVFRRQRPTMHGFPSIGLPVPKRPIRLVPFPIREEIGITDRDTCPVTVLLIPAALDPKRRMESGIAGAVELEAAMRSGRMEHHALRIDSRALRHAPRCGEPHSDIFAAERFALPEVGRDHLDVRAKARFVGDDAFAPEDVFLVPLGKGSGQPPARCEAEAVPRRNGDIAQVDDPRRHHAGGGHAIFDHDPGHAALLSFWWRAGAKSGP